MESGEKDLLSKQAILNLPRDKEFNLEGKLLAEYINVKDIEALPTIQSVATDTNVGNNSEIPNSSDCISRQAAAELAMKYCPDDDGAVQCDGDIRGLLDELENLPPAQPEPKEGEWIPVHPLQGDDPGAYMCSKCKTGMWEIRPSAYHYCPNCGAHMRGEKDG